MAFQKCHPYEEIVTIESKKATSTHSDAVNSVKFIIFL